MATHSFTRIIRKVLATVACTCAALAFGVAQAAPGGGGGGQPPRCTLNSPNPVNIDVGDSTIFSAIITRDSPTYTVTWSYPGGDDGDTPPPLGVEEEYTETGVVDGGQVDSPPVFYNSNGQFVATVTATGQNNRSCNQSVTINVGGGGPNQPPNAVDDEYDVADDQTLVIAAPGVLGNDTDETPPALLTATLVQNVTKGALNLNPDGSFSYTPGVPGPDSDSFTYTATDDGNPPLTSNEATVTITINATGAVTARGDAYATPIGKDLNVTATRVSGVLYNDFGGTPPLAVVGTLAGSGTEGGTYSLSADGSFSYSPPAGAIDNIVDTFTYTVEDQDGAQATATVAVQILSDQPDYKMTMNYELGMHCTGFEFAYCCVLPPYNSIVAQITKPNTTDPDTGADFARLLDATEDPATKDGLGRETVLRDLELDGGEFAKYVVRYYHDAQPRLEGQGKAQGSTLISNAEGASLYYQQSKVDSAALGANKELIYGSYADGAGGAVAYGVWQGDGSFTTPCSPAGGLADGCTDNYANAWLNHFYIYADLEGTIPEGVTSLESEKVRLGVAGHVEYPKNVGASLQPLGPDGNVSGFDNVLTFSTDTGTVVYTQMKVLENLPVMLTSPRMWEALGLPLTPFEDSINFFGNPGLVDEDTIRPYVAMKARMYHYDGGGNDQPVIGSNGLPVIGFGTAPIDIPNCERCHSAAAMNAQGDPNVNSPSYQKRVGGPQPWGDPFNTGYDLEGLTDQEYQFWMFASGITPGVGSDWYPRLKAAAINMLAIHDDENGTGFTANYPGCGSLGNSEDQTGCGSTGTTEVQNNRLGFESIICQRCHADNVIANVKSACEVDPGSSSLAPLCPDVGSAEGRQIIQPITEALHWNHRGTDEAGGVIHFSDDLGRDGGCQGCHPAHRSDGVTDGYPITLDGNNASAGGDNRLAPGGCFVGRDVHSNPLKDVDGAETEEYLNAVGQWLSDRVYDSPSPNTGIWCTNCHNQLGQSIWAAENMVDLINGIPGKEADLTTDAVNIRALPTLDAIEAELGLDPGQAEIWLDPVDGPNDTTHSIWNPDVTANPDAAVALIEAAPADSGGCNPNVAPNPFFLPRFSADACLSFDLDPGGAVGGGVGDPSVRILDFCTTPDCTTLADRFLMYEGTCQGGDNDGAVCTTEGTCQGGDNDGELCATDGSIGADCSVGAGTCVGISNGTGADCSAGGGACARNSTGLSFAFAAPFDAATDGRDHWLSPGEPHCADCHAAPFTEQSGNNNFFPPFNYPRKASLMRYSRGHQDLTCQSCHESIHGLYPVSPTIDSTSYAQAAALNPDGSHGPLKCGTCHLVNGEGVPSFIQDGITYPPGDPQGLPIVNDYELAVAWAHTFTDEASPLVTGGFCVNCHEDNSALIASDNRTWTEHAFKGRSSRQLMDKAEVEQLGHLVGDPDFEDPLTTVCTSCHGDRSNTLTRKGCTTKWKNHLIEGRASELVWEYVSDIFTSTNCGW